MLEISDHDETWFVGSFDDAELDLLPDWAVDAVTGVEYRANEVSRCKGAGPSDSLKSSHLRDREAGTQDIVELQYIAPLVNLRSILERGILSHRLANRFPHQSVAMAEVQERRAARRVPNGRPLHDYANLYFNAANPMMYKLRGMHRDLCVLRVSTSVMELEGSVITDGNAASSYTLFMPYPDGLSKIDRGVVFGPSWSHPDPAEMDRRRRVRCAEVLVPDRVPPEFIVGVRVSCHAIAVSPALTTCGLPATIDERMFFLL